MPIFLVAPYSELGGWFSSFSVETPITNLKNKNIFGTMLYDFLPNIV